MSEEKELFIRSDAQIDQLILTEHFQHTKAVKKIPRIIKTITFELDEKGQKIPLRDERNRLIVDADGQIQYLVKEVKERIDGWMPQTYDYASIEPVSNDLGTTFLTVPDAKRLKRLIYLWKALNDLNEVSPYDFSLELNDFASTINGIAQVNKSLLGNGLATVKTFTTRSEGVMKSIDLTGVPPKQESILTKIGKLFGGKRGQTLPPQGPSQPLNRESNVLDGSQLTR